MGIIKNETEQDSPNKIREQLMMTREEYKAKSEGVAYYPKKRYN